MTMKYSSTVISIYPTCDKQIDDEDDDDDDDDKSVMLEDLDTYQEGDYKGLSFVNCVCLYPSLYLYIYIYIYIYVHTDLFSGVDWYSPITGIFCWYNKYNIFIEKVLQFMNKQDDK